MANIKASDVSAQSLLTTEELQLLREFEDVKARLRVAGIVRSGNVTGDIGEWLMVRQYGLELHPSCRNKGFEGYIELEGVRYRAQVKVHNAGIGKNQMVGDPTMYDMLIVLIGPESTLRDASVKEGGPGSFHVYIFEPADIMARMHRYRDGTYSFAKTVLHAGAPDNIIAV